MALNVVVNGNQPGNDISASWWNSYGAWLTSTTVGGSAPFRDTPFYFTYDTAGGTTLTVNGGASTTSSFAAVVGADSQSWFTLGTNYKINIGPGGGTAPDVQIFRSNTSELTIVGNLKVSGSFSTTQTGQVTYGSVAVTAKDTSGAFQLPGYTTNVDCPGLWWDGQMTSPGQVWAGARTGGSGGQKDWIFNNQTSGWNFWRTTGGQFHFLDTQASSDSFVIQPLGIYSKNVQWAHSNGYGTGTFKTFNFGGGQSTIAHGLGYSPGYANIIAWAYVGNPSTTYSYSVGGADASNIVANCSASTNCFLWVG